MTSRPEEPPPPRAPCYLLHFLSFSSLIIDSGRPRLPAFITCSPLERQRWLGLSARHLFLLAGRVTEIKHETLLDLLRSSLVKAFPCLLTVIPASAASETQLCLFHSIDSLKSSCTHEQNCWLKKENPSALTEIP